MAIKCINFDVNVGTCDYYSNMISNERKWVELSQSQFISKHTKINTLIES